VMVVTVNPNEGPRLVTTYPVTRHFHQLEKRPDAVRYKDTKV